LIAVGPALSFGPRRKGQGRQPLRPLPCPLPPDPLVPLPLPLWPPLRPSASSFFSASYIRLMSLFHLSSAREIGDVVQVRNDGEHRKLEIVLALLLEGGAPIENLDRHCRRGAEHEPGKETEDQRYPRRVLGVERWYRAIDHAD